MKIEKKPKFSKSFANILFYISKDKKSAAIKFEQGLNKKILNLVSHPKKYRKSYYFEDESYRDLIYSGYTIIYKIDTLKDKILILEIFKWQNR